MNYPLSFFPPPSAAFIAADRIPFSARHARNFGNRQYQTTTFAIYDPASIYPLGILVLTSHGEMFVYTKQHMDDDDDQIYYIGSKKWAPKWDRVANTAHGPAYSIFGIPQGSDDTVVELPFLVLPPGAIKLFEILVDSRYRGTIVHSPMPSNEIFENAKIAARMHFEDVRHKYETMDDPSDSESSENPLTDPW